MLNSRHLVLKLNVGWKTYISYVFSNPNFFDMNSSFMMCSGNSKLVHQLASLHVTTCGLLATFWRLLELEYFVTLTIKFILFFVNITANFFICVNRGSLRLLGWCFLLILNRLRWISYTNWDYIWFSAYTIKTFMCYYHCTLSYVYGYWIWWMTLTCIILVEFLKTRVIGIVLVLTLISGKCGHLMNDKFVSN